MNSVKKSVNYHSFRVYLLSKRTYQLCLGLGVKPNSGPITSALYKFNPEVGVAHLLRIKKTNTTVKNEKEDQGWRSKRTVRRSEGRNYISFVIRHSSFIGVGIQ